MKEYKNTLGAAVLALARRPEGYVFSDPVPGFPDVTRHQLYRCIQTLSDTNRIHRLQISVTSFRYFGNLADRERLAMDQPERQPKIKKGRVKVATPRAKPLPNQKPCLPASVHIKSYARGPAYLPGDPLITSKTKFTFGVSPMNPSRTNTHAE